MKKIFTEDDISTASFYVWGAGLNCRHFFDQLNFLGWDSKKMVRAIIDNNVDKQGQVCFGVRVRSPQEILSACPSGKGALIVICSSDKALLEIEAVINRDFPESVYGRYQEIEYDSQRDFKTKYGEFMAEGDDCRLISRCMRYDDWERPSFVSHLQNMKIYEPKRHIRKPWELAYTAEVLDKAGVLQKGKKGLGFAVGTERLPSYFASMGVEVTASDLAADKIDSQGWIATNQNAGGNLSKLHYSDLCSINDFMDNVRYRDIDMNHMPEDERGYDFCWSICAIEHVGSLQLSLEFMKNMLTVLRPGGWAVHTTEFNLSSNDTTVYEGGTVLWRRRDVEYLQRWMLAHGHQMEITFERGKQLEDYHVEMSPFHYTYKDLISFYYAGYITTGFALVIRKSLV